jgi:hypothetical protein
MPSSSGSTRDALNTTPLLQFRLFGHRAACFAWVSAERREKAVREILDVARRVPFALPFTLYFRIDSAQALRHAGGAMQRERQQRYDAGRATFDLRHFVSQYAERTGRAKEAAAAHAEAVRAAAAEEADAAEWLSASLDPGPSDELPLPDTTATTTTTTGAISYTAEERAAAQAEADMLNPDGWE